MLVNELAAGVAYVYRARDEARSANSRGCPRYPAGNSGNEAGCTHQHYCC
jgi:hypothetical protein